MNLPIQTAAALPSFFEFQNVWDFNEDGVKDAVRVSKVAQPSVEDQQFGFGEIDKQPWVASIAYMNAEGVVIGEKLAEDDLGYTTRIAEDFEKEDEIFSVCVTGAFGPDAARSEICIEREKLSAADIMSLEAAGGVVESSDTGRWRLAQRIGSSETPFHQTQPEQTVSVPDMVPLPVSVEDVDLVSRGPLVVRFLDRE